MDFTGAIGTMFNRKEFAVKKEDIEFIRDGCWSSLHLLLIMQTPPTPVLMQVPVNYNRIAMRSKPFFNQIDILS